MMIKAGAEIRNLGDVKWLATEDKSKGKGTSRHIACFVLKKIIWILRYLTPLESTKPFYIIKYLNIDGRC
jgi:hypothetical protein